MSGMTNFLENEIGDHILRGRSYTAPTQLHVALHTANPGETGATAELTGNNYARAQLNPSFSNWKGSNNEVTAVDSAGTGGLFRNNQTVPWPTPSANWGLVTHFSIWDAAGSGGSGGNCLFYGELTASKTINANDTVSASVDALSVTFA
jgi:hypothetical protein